MRCQGLKTNYSFSMFRGILKPPRPSGPPEPPKLEKYVFCGYETQTYGILRHDFLFPLIEYWLGLEFQYRKIQTDFQHWKLDFVCSILVVDSFVWTHGLVNQLSFHCKFPNMRLWFCKIPPHYLGPGFCQKDCWKSEPSLHDYHLLDQNPKVDTEKWLKMLWYYVSYFSF